MSTPTKRKRLPQPEKAIGADTPMPMKAIMGAIKTIPIDDIQAHPRNARKGDVSVVAESLKYHGQFRPLVVQKSTRFILAGNHTWMAAKSLGWKEIAVTFLDVDDDQALKILLVDNAASDQGSYDYDALMDIIQDVSSPIGTGYTQDIIDNINGLMADLTAGMNDNGGEVPEHARGTSAFGEDDDPIDVDEFDDISSLMPGVNALKPDVVFMTEDWYGIPDLLPEMLFPRIDINVDTWSGPTSSTDDGESLFMYTYGTDSTKGMPWDRTILNFYTSDSRFENWWADPAKYTAKMVNAGIAGSVSHDFSLFAGLPRVLHIFNIYRSRWLSRYMQEAGIKIIPSITFADLSSIPFSTAGIPVGAPVVAIQMQTIDDLKLDRAMNIRLACIAESIDVIQPEQLLVYGNTPGFKIIEDMGLDCEIILAENRSIRRSRWQKERDKAVYKDSASRKKSSRVTGVSQSGVAMRGF